MARELVQVTGLIAAKTEDVWTILADFSALWHPMVEMIRVERDARGALVRVFTVKGEAGLYREQLTYMSESDRVLGYTHLDGIADCNRYNAQISVTMAGTGGCIVTWSAEIEASAKRLRSICDGTRAVFEAGLAALPGQLGCKRPEGPQAAGPSAISGILIDSLPRLALTVAVSSRPDPSTRKGKGAERLSANRDGRLCLFLHGIGGGSANWMPQLRAAGGIMQAAAMDLRGYGESALGPAQTTIDDYCADILRVAETLGAYRLVLVGLSYGSWIAASFAMRYPKMLDGLVLSGGCTGMSEAGPEEREAFRSSRELPLNAGQSPADFAPAVVKLLAGPTASDATKQALFDSMAAIPAATYRDALVCFTNPTERLDFLRMTMPVLMMTGEYDRLAPPAEIRGVANRIRNASMHPSVQFEIIPDAGHVCNVEAPEAYNRHLLRFLRDLPQ